MQLKLASSLSCSWGPLQAELKKSGNTVLANVHDAVVVRNQIPAKLLAKIERKVQQRTGVGYFRLGETGY